MHVVTKVFVSLLISAISKPTKCGESTISKEASIYNMEGKKWHFAKLLPLSQSVFVQYTRG